jgi:hypothetical protein
MYTGGPLFGVVIRFSGIISFVFKIFAKIFHFLVAKNSTFLGGFNCVINDKISLVKGIVS